MLCEEKEAETRFLAAPKADPTFSDMFMNDDDVEMDDLGKEGSKNVNNYTQGGLHSTEVAFLLLTQQPRLLFPAFPKTFLRYFFMSLGHLLTALLREKRTEA